MDQRYYEPATGRFISPDLIRFAGGLNLYSYCDNDPVGAVDPSGLDWAKTRAWLDQHIFHPLREVGDAVGRASNFMGTMLVFGGCGPGWVGPDWRTIPEEKRHRSPTERFFLENLAVAASVSGGGLGTGAAGALGEATAIAGRGQTLRQLLTPEELAEYETLRREAPEYMPDLDAPGKVRSSEQIREARRQVPGPGHHRHPLSLGGDASPAGGLLQTGDTRTWKNPTHVRVSNFWNKVLRRLRGGG